MSIIRPVRVAIWFMQADPGGTHSTFVLNALAAVCPLAVIALSFSTFVLDAFRAGVVGARHPSDLGSEAVFWGVR